MKYDKIDTKLKEFRKANPWVILNIQNSMACCGRFPSRLEAVAYAIAEYGETVSINDESKTVLVSCIPAL